MKSPKQFLLIIICMTLSWLASYEAAAQSTPASGVNTVISRISTICLNSPFDCLENIDQSLAKVSPKSRVYYEILQYKFEALFNLQRVDELYAETKKWVGRTELPLPFQVTNAIYYAKMAYWRATEKESKESYEFAKSLLAQMNDQYPSPMRLVQFANLQMQQKEYQAAYSLLSGLADKYQNSPNYHLMSEIHGNLGHAANQMGNPKQALVHWLDTEQWVALFGNKQQMAVSAFNLADIYEQLSQFEQANLHFSRSVTLALEAGDIKKANQARFHLSRVMVKQKEYCLAKKVFNQIDVHQLPKKRAYDLDSLNKATQAC